MVEAHFLSSWLFVPGNDARKIDRAAASQAQVVILDWEDAVLPEQKNLARQCSREIDALRRCGKPIFIRVNSSPTEWHKDDLQAVAAIRPHGVIVPKCESAEEVREIIATLQKASPDWEFGLCPLIESPRGLLRAEAIATASDRVMALAFGSYDFCTAAQISPSPEEIELLMARSQIVTVARAHRLAAVDSPVLVLDDLQLVRVAAARSCRLGFSGKLAIHPKHIEAIAEAFAPTPDEARKAKEILQQAEVLKQGAFAWNGQMVDEAILEKARITLKRLQASSKP